MKIIKKILIVIYLIATFLICAHLDAQVTFATPQIPANIYPSFGLVTDVSETPSGTYVITVSDFEGFAYSYYSEDGDLQNGDGIAFMMDNMNTISIYDDQIIGRPRYVGHIELWNQMAYENVISEIYCGEELVSTN